MSKIIIRILLGLLLALGFYCGYNFFWGKPYLLILLLVLVILLARLNDKLTVLHK